MFCFAWVLPQDNYCKATVEPSFRVTVRRAQSETFRLLAGEDDRRPSAANHISSNSFRHLRALDIHSRVCG